MPDTTRTGRPTSTLQEDTDLVGAIDPVALDKLLDEWMNGDAEEQRETFEALRKGLDENRPEGYKLFS